MGGSHTSMYTSQTTQVMNNVIADAKNTCGANLTANQNNNLYIISGVRGRVDISQEGTVTASCYMQNNLQTNIVNDLVQKSTQQLNESQSLLASLTGLNLSLSSNSRTTRAVQSAVVSNRVAQIMASTCRSDENLNQSNNVYIIQDSTGEFRITQKGSSTSTCSMSNTSKIGISNSISQIATESIKIVNTLVGIIIAIAIIVAVVGVIALLLKARASSSQAGEDTNIDAQTEASPIPGDDIELTTISTTETPEPQAAATV